MKCAQHLIAFFLRIFIFLCFPLVSLSQDVLEGQVIHKITESVIPGVTVRLLKENLTTSTNERGYFRLISENPVPGDTLVFSSVGFRTYSVPVAGYRINSFVSLEPETTTLEEVGITNRKLKRVVLNKFGLGDLKDDPDADFYTEPFYGISFAKLFTAPEGNLRVLDIQLGRREMAREYRVGGANRPLIKSNLRARFLIHFMSVDPGKKTPGSILFTKEIDLTDNALWVTLDFSKDNLLISEPEFYVAVEWLKIPYNETIGLGYAQKVRHVTKKGKQLLEEVSKYTAVYQPALVSYKKVKAAVSWIKGRDGNWYRYNEGGTPRESEVAISATIDY